MKKKYKLGILGFKHNGELSIPKLKKLAKEALSFFPLNEIFKVPYVSTRKISSNGYFYSSDATSIAWDIMEGKNLNIIAIISEELYPQYSPLTRMIECDYSNPARLAHELGHSLGLEHPYANCAKTERSKVVCNDCTHRKYLMGCLSERTKSFSPEDIEKLERWFLK